MNKEMKTTKIWRIALTMVAVLSLASCSSEPQWTDPEAHEKTEELQKKYGPLLIGTWHFERLGERNRFFEQLTFHDDNTLTGYRKWQNRSLVTVEGQEVYTDWEDVEGECGTFTGTWMLRYMSPEGPEGEKRNCLTLMASFDDDDDSPASIPYSSSYNFNYVDETTLSFQTYYFNDADGWRYYRRGEGEPSTN